MSFCKNLLSNQEALKQGKDVYKMTAGVSSVLSLSLMKRAILFLSIISLSEISVAQDSEKVIVHFRFNKYELDESEKQKIDSAFSNKPVSWLRIDAHCDSIGDDTYNINLSIHRAFVVKDYLSSKKFLPDTFEFNAHGRGMPLNNNASEEERALNRRAEIIFTKRMPPAGIKDSSANAIKAEALIKKDTMAAKDTTMFSAENVERSEEGATLRLPNLNFYYGRHVLMASSKKTLQLLLSTMRDNPTLQIEIQGHICCHSGGEDGYDYDSHNMTLSVNRAKAIYDYLVKKGINERRLSYRGFGSAHKLAEEERNEYDKMLNRRVEIKIVKK